MRPMSARPTSPLTGARGQQSVDSSAQRTGPAHLMAWRGAPRLLQHRPALFRQVDVVQVHLRMRRCRLRMRPHQTLRTGVCPHAA